MPWQTCPICDGCGTVPWDFYDYDQRRSTAMPPRQTCRACNGRGVLYDYAAAPVPVPVPQPYYPWWPQPVWQRISYADTTTMAATGVTYL
jgi:hypothetical protein